MPPDVDTAAPAPADTAAPPPDETTTPPSTGDGDMLPTPADTAAPTEPAPAVDTPAPPAPDADTPDPTQTTPDLNGSDQVGTDEWMAVLNDDTRALFQEKGYVTPNDLGKAYRELSTKLGERVLSPPADDADTGEWDVFYDKMGRPAAPDGYQFSLPDGVPEDMPYDSDFANQFKGWAHEEGLSARQAQRMHDRYVRDYATPQMQAAHEQLQERVTNSHESITKKWGLPESDGYRREVELGRRAIKQLDLQEAFTAAGLMEQGTGMVTDAKLAFAMAKIGGRMFAEDTMYSGPGAGIVNPFSDATSNMTQQSLLIKSDPRKAANLIRAAGKKPTDFGMIEGG